MASTRGRKRSHVKPQPTAQPKPVEPEADASTAESSQKAQAQAATKRQARRERAQELSRTKRQEWLLVGGLLAVTAVAFANSLGGEFVYDDHFQVVRNPTLNALSNIPRMFTQSVWQFMNQSASDSVGAYYRPMFNIALIINHNLFGLNAAAWHLVSLALHLSATFLVYKLALRWQVTREVAAAAALIFGLHPLHSESVAWVSGLADPLAAVFLLGSLLLYERTYHKTPLRNFAAISVALAFLAMLSKETALMFPVFLVIREWLDCESQESMASALGRMARRTAPYLVAAAIYLALRYAVLGFLSKAEPKAAAITATQVMLTIPSVLLAYVRMLLVPYPLAVTYDHGYVSSASDPRFWGALLAVAAIATGAALITRGSMVARRALVFMALFLLPVLNLKAFNHNESLIHDRYLYLPSIGFCLLAALALSRLSELFAARRELVFQAATAAVAVILFGLTINQNRYWQNDFAMANRALEINPASPFLYNYLGAMYSQRNRPLDAEGAYQRALGFDPNYYDSLTNLGDLYRVQNRLSEAEHAYLKAIEAGAPYADTYYNLGVTYTSMRRLADAEQPLMRAAEMNPRSAEARYNLGWVYDQQGKLAEAEQAYIEALKVRPEYPEPRINLALVYSRQSRFKEALDHLFLARQYAPEHQVLLFALGEVYMKTSRFNEAIEAFAQLARRNPQFQSVHTNLGLCYEATGNKQQAIASFQKAIQLAPQEAATSVARERLAKLQN